MIKLTPHQKKYINATALKWIEALKSGIYLQGENYLRTKYGEFCCLGVACEIAPEITGGHHGNSPSWYKFETDAHDGVLPGEYHKKLGLHTPHGNYGPCPSAHLHLESDGLIARQYIVIDGETIQAYTIAGLNDTGNYDLNNIADVLLDQCDKFFMPIKENNDD